MRWMFPCRLAAVISAVSILTACADKPSKPDTPAYAKVKIGKPYVINGKTYYPEYDPTYDKIGDASWYGPGFHGKYTANGEVFDQNDMTAAHPTLPMPSLVRVTNLKTGKSKVVRINDRGPFKRNRIIDLSKRSAEELGIHSTQPVRVQYLHKETEAYLNAMQAPNAQPIDMAQYNRTVEEARTDVMEASTQPADQIEEYSVASSHPGQLINSAAPVVTVTSGELGTPAVQVRTSAPTTVEVQEVWADDNRTLPAPPAAAAPQVRHVAHREAQVRMAPVAGQYIIQAGSFAEEMNARTLVSNLQDMARTAIDKVDIGARTWWRVRLGPFDDKAMADDVLGRVRAYGLPDARLIRL